MNYIIIIKKSSKKEISKLPSKYKTQMIEAIRELIKPNHNLDVKPILNMVNTYRLRVGKYRVLYYLDKKENTITIWRVGHRSIAYRDL